MREILTYLDTHICYTTKKDTHICLKKKINNFNLKFFKIIFFIYNIRVFLSCANLHMIEKPLTNMY